MKQKADGEAAIAKKKEKAEVVKKELDERLATFEAETSEEDDAMDAASGNDADPDYLHADTDSALRKPTQNRLRLKNAAKQTIRTGTTPGAASLILSGGFIDIGFVTKEENHNICSSGKLRREVDRVLDEFQVGVSMCDLVNQINMIKQ